MAGARRSSAIAPALGNVLAQSAWPFRSLSGISSGVRWSTLTPHNWSPYTWRGRKDYSGPTRQLANQLLISGLVNSAECNLTKLYMLIGFWPVSLNRSSVMRS